MPDIVCEINEKRFAFEIETGTMPESPGRFKIKKSVLDEQNLNGWYFVVTSKHLVKEYKKLGKVLDPRSLKGQLDKIIKKS